MAPSSPRGLLSRRTGVQLLRTQAVLTTVLATFFLATGNPYRWVALAAATLYAVTAVWHAREGQAAAAVAVIGTAVLIGFATQEPFLTGQVGLGIFVPAILATVLLSPRLILVTMAVQWAVLLARADGRGVLAQPMNLVLGAMIAGGLAFARALTDAALASANEQARRAECALAESDKRRDENERLQERLIEAQKLETLGRLAGGVAHDFNNLLTVILNFAALAQASLDKPTEADECLDEVRRASERAAGLTKQLLAFARRQRLEKSVVDVAKLVEDASRTLGQLAGQRVRIVRNVASGLPVVLADPGQLEQVLMNLVANARDAMDGTGDIHLALTPVTIKSQSPEGSRGVRPGDYLRLMVADSGAGMAPELALKIFEPFFTTKGPDRGTGLGLSTCIGIVQQHDGFMLVDSVVDKGTVMTVLLPIVEGRRASEEVPLVAGAQQQTRGMILLVEDDPLVREVTFRILTRGGFEVETAPDAVVALTRLRDVTLPVPDLMLTDLMMPGMNGEELADKARVLAPKLPVLLMTGFSGPRTLASDEGATRLIEKPFLPARLITIIAQMLGPAVVATSPGARADASSGGPLSPSGV